VSVPDPYKVLQVDPEAEDEVIEAAYRRLARKYHPDVAAGDEARERMVRINQAWEMLKDPTRRAAVDRARRRQDASAAAAAAADTRSTVTGRGPTEATGGAGSAQGGTDARAHTWRGATPPPSWPPGVRDPSTDDAARTQRTSPDWSPGRSTSGGGYDATMRSADSAGPPPGNPSGTVLDFGRYAGWSLGEIARTDLEYLEWLDRMPIGRAYQAEIDTLLRARGRRATGTPQSASQQGLYRRR
jgi:curved DNA-binding protein CbpA